MLNRFFRFLLWGRKRPLERLTSDPPVPATPALRLIVNGEEMPAGGFTLNAGGQASATGTSTLPSTFSASTPFSDTAPLPVTQGAPKHKARSKKPPARPTPQRGTPA